MWCGHDSRLGLTLQYLFSRWDEGAGALRLPALRPMSESFDVNILGIVPVYRLIVRQPQRILSMRARPKDNGNGCVAH